MEITTEASLTIPAPAFVLSHVRYLASSRFRNTRQLFRHRRQLDGVVQELALRHLHTLVFWYLAGYELLRGVDFQRRSRPASDLMCFTRLLLGEKVTGTLHRSHPGMLSAWERGKGVTDHASLGHSRSKTGFEPLGLFSFYVSRAGVTC